ncbi:hypothetical protein AB3R30_08490 [Leptolyngbyaceae cyanobacterium UHCC 1019]
MPHSCFFPILTRVTRSTFYCANIARQLALAATLAEMEAEAARNFTENSPSTKAA